MVTAFDPMKLLHYREFERLDRFNKKAQSALENMGSGPAAELLRKVVDRGAKIRNPSRYVAEAAKHA